MPLKGSQSCGRALEIAALPTLAWIRWPGSSAGCAHRPGVQVRMLEPDTVNGVDAMVKDGACELGATHLPASGRELVAYELAQQELLVVLPPRTKLGERPLRARELAEIPLVVSPLGTSTRILLEQALAAVGVSTQIAVETAAREAVVPLVLAGAGAGRCCRRRSPIKHTGEVPSSVRVRPSITRRVGLIHGHGNLFRPPPVRSSRSRAPRTEQRDMRLSGLIWLTG